jgi:ribosomal protein S18 acetylase RimI-like enzyme
VSRFYSEALGKLDRAAFTSGNDKIDAYFRATVSQDVKRKYAACYVLIEKETGKLAGFYTLSSSNFPLMEIPPEVARKLPRYPTIPAILIGWLGRDIAFKRQSIGEMLLHDAIFRIMSSPVGAYALVADAIDDKAAAFYREHQFTPFLSKPLSLYLPLATAMSLPNMPNPGN